MKFSYCKCLLYASKSINISIGIEILARVLLGIGSKVSTVVWHIPTLQCDSYMPTILRYMFQFDDCSFPTKCPLENGSQVLVS